MRSDLYQVVALRRDKSCGRVADKFGLREWTINLRTWIFGLTCLVFKTTYIDAEKPLRDGAFSFTRRTLFPPLNKRNTRDKARSLCITSERHIGELGVRCLSTINREQDSAAPVSLDVGRVNADKLYLYLYIGCLCGGKSLLIGIYLPPCSL